MDDNELLKRIVINENTLAGKPVIKGTRLSVDFIISLLAHEMSIDDILNEYKGLQKEDVLACLLFAQQSIESAIFVPSSA
jgi:uncharacterized protein (DUF433 family)